MQPAIIMATSAMIQCAQFFDKTAIWLPGASCNCCRAWAILRHSSPACFQVQDFHCPWKGWRKKTSSGNCCSHCKKRLSGEDAGIQIRFGYAESMKFPAAPKQLFLFFFFLFFPFLIDDEQFAIFHYPCFSI